MKTSLLAAALSPAAVLSPALVLLLAACAGPAQTQTPAAPVAATAPLTAAAAAAVAPVPVAPEPKAQLASQTAVPQQLVFPEAEAFRDVQPVAGAPHAFRLPKVQRFDVKGGI